MPNFNPLTNAVGGAGATSPSAYHSGTPRTNYGEYQYIYLSEAVDNFIATYVGEGKILQNVMKGDVNFHAHRAVQELHYDTLRSCKSFEREICPGLQMALPNDYVNYVKLTWVDDNGIEHIIYPTRHTSNPFAIEQDDCAYVFNGDGTYRHQQDCVAGEDLTCDPSDFNAWFNYLRYNTVGPTFPQTLTILGEDFVIDSYEHLSNILIAKVDAHCNCLGNILNSPVSCGNFIGWTYNPAATVFPGVSGGWTGDPISEGSWNGVIGQLAPGNWGLIAGETAETCTLYSDAWNNFSTSGNTNQVSIDASTTTSLAVDADNYFQNVGQRYGLQPEHAQVNGSFFIDCARGLIHFGSNFSGKTIILHYISDGIEDPDQIMVHKFAEEALYKWIAYGCLIARADTPEYVIQRFKKEKFAETRKAKIRLSNVKIEEISQIMRNKSKWIKH